MKIKLTLLALTASMLLTGCMSIESINSKIAPVNQWYQQDYETTRFTQRYKFTKADIDLVRKGILTILPQIGMSASYSTDDIVASGNPTTMFSTAECESWSEVDRAKSKELSDGLIGLTCDSNNKNSLITATVNLKSFSQGTLMILNYETNNPKVAAYGIVFPRRPPPAASKAGAAKFWDYLGQVLAAPIRDATKEDLL
jgi:hypothetical protein